MRVTLDRVAFYDESKNKKKKSYDFLILHYAISLIAFAKRAF